MILKCFYLSIIGCIIAVCVSVNGINLENELNISRDQKIAIDKLRNMTLPYISEAYMKDDLHLLRWLRATQFNVDEAKRGIIEDIEWRKKKNIQNILDEDFTDVLEDYPYLYTFDKQSQPTFIAFIGEWDIRHAVVIGKGPRIIRFLAQLVEAARRTVRDMQLEGRNVTRANLILSLEGFNLVQHACPQCLARIIEFVLIVDNHYPGITDRIYFISAPPTVAATLELVKNAANPETRKGMRVFGNDRNSWQKAVYSFMSSENLPQEIGGTKHRSVFKNPLYSTEGVRKLKSVV